MSKEIGELYAKLKAEVELISKQSQEKKQLMDLLRTQCTHDYQYSHTCGHKGEDYNKCTWCEKVV